MIWCVEDDSSIRDIELYALNSAGFETKGFEDGTSFWNALKNEKPELVVLDVMLPGMDGIELLTKMKESADLYNKKVRWIEATYPNARAITSEELQNLIKDALVTKCSLDSAFNIVVDDDSLEAVRTIFRGIDSGSIYIMVDYMITDDVGGYYDASARFLMNK